MKSRVKTALCTLFLMAASIVVAEGSVPAENGAPEEQVKSAEGFQQTFLEHIRLRKHYSGLLEKARRVSKDEEVVAERKNVYAALKKMGMVMKTKMQLTPEELADIDAFMVALKKSYKNVPEIEEMCFIENNIEAMTDVANEYMESLEQEDFEKMVKAEYEMFLQS